MLQETLIQGLGDIGHGIFGMEALFRLKHVYLILQLRFNFISFKVIQIIIIGLTLLWQVLPKQFIQLLFFSLVLSILLFIIFFSQDVTSFDRFYVTFFNNDQQNGASFTANLYSSRVEYDPSASSALYSCQTPCQGHYDYASDQFAIIQTTFNTGSQEVTWQGVNRPNYYGVIFGIIFTGVVFLFFCCLYRDYQRYQRVKDNPNVEMNTLNNQSGQHPMVIAQQIPVAQVHTQLQPFQSHSQYYPQTLGQPYPYTQPQQSIPIGQVVALPMSAQQPQYPMYYPQQQPMAHHSYAPQDLQQYS